MIEQEQIDRLKNILEEVIELLVNNSFLNRADARHLYDKLQLVGK